MHIKQSFLNERNKPKASCELARRGVRRGAAQRWSPVRVVGLAWILDRWQFV